ncbi:MAG: DUF3021 family protein [Lachnospiraceae bacterium]|nr:DUF3021 family protein [Lachnospiraceae bacterium]
MKKILRDTCIIAALMILTVFTFSIMVVGFTAEIKLVYLLSALALIVSALNYFIDEMMNLPILLSYVVKYFAVSIVVMLFGFIVGWFYASNFWMVFIYVGIVAVVLYFLDLIRTEKDIRTINEMVRLSRDQQTGKNTEHKE